ncbi:hypothetical protein ACLQ2R_06015 [Streptosporangium sp. DT93]|uniref:hypothetical protein n=1 Tax=Streptosporangium sp. DT93 TaxID=3393428 RepID=UPI003CEFB884
MFKHAFAATALVASSLVVATTMSAQPAGASATIQEGAQVARLLTDPPPGEYRQQGYGGHQPWYGHQHHWHGHHHHPWYGHHHHGHDHHHGWYGHY